MTFLLAVVAKILEKLNVLKCFHLLQMHLGNYFYDVSGVGKWVLRSFSGSETI